MLRILRGGNRLERFKNQRSTPRTKNTGGSHSDYTLHYINMISRLLKKKNHWVVFCLRWNFILKYGDKANLSPMFPGRFFFLFFLSSFPEFTSITLALFRGKTLVKKQNNSIAIFAISDYMQIIISEITEQYYDEYQYHVNESLMPNLGF